MKKLAGRIGSPELIRRPWLRKTTITGEEARFRVPKTRTNRAWGRSQGGDPLAFIAERWGTSKRTFNTSGRRKEPTTLTRRRVQTKGVRIGKERRQSWQARKSCCSSPRKTSYTWSTTKRGGWSTPKRCSIWSPTRSASYLTEPEITMSWCGVCSVRKSDVPRTFHEITHKNKIIKKLVEAHWFLIRNGSGIFNLIGRGLWKWLCLLYMQIALFYSLKRGIFFSS
mgnify:CR=1 FL=1